MSMKRLTRQDAYGGNVNAGSTSVSYPNATTVGNLLIAIVAGFGATTPNLSNSGWSTTITGGNGTNVSGGMFSKIADGTETSITGNATTANGTGLLLMEYAINSDTISTDGTAGTNNNGSSSVTTRATQPITTSNGNDLILSVVIGGTAGSGYTWDSSFVFGGVSGTVTWHIVCGELVAGAPLTSFSNTCNWTGATQACSLIAAFHESGSYGYSTSGANYGTPHVQVGNGMSRSEVAN